MILKNLKYQISIQKNKNDNFIIVNEILKEEGGFNKIEKIKLILTKEDLKELKWEIMNSENLL